MSDYFINEIISVSVSKTIKTDVGQYIATVLMCFRWNLLIFMYYLCSVGKFKKNIKNEKK